MTPVISSKPQAFFLNGGAGRLFAVFHRPCGKAPHRGNVLVVPAFNEEMNRCRSMITLQAQRFAEHGIGTLVIDLAGTGESDGEYGDARWDGWCNDIRLAMTWLETEQPGGCVALLAIRLGVPLAIAALHGQGKYPALIAWQPVVDGKSYMTQFMRMRIAANMERTDIPRETTSEMRASLAAGNNIEIAGYDIHPDLAAAIETIQLADTVPDAKVATVWFERGGGEVLDPSPGSRKVLDAWSEASCTADVDVFDGPAFWALHDRHLIPALIERTATWLNSHIVKK